MLLTIKKNLQIQSILFGLFTLIAFGLGYATLSRYNPALLESVSDSSIYYGLVEHGLAGINSDHRSSRILVPFLAKGLFFFVNGKSGVWNPVLLSLLIVNALFCAALALLIFKMAGELMQNAMIGLLASFLFLANFAVTNLYLSGLVDSAEAFFILLSIYFIFKRSWPQVVLVSIFGAFAKETFFPIMSLFYVSWWLISSYQNKNYDFKALGYMTAAMGFMFFIVIGLKSYSYNQLMWPWQYAAVLKTKDIHDLGWYLRELRRFCYVFVFLLPLAIPHIKKLPREWSLASGVSALGIVCLTIVSGGSGSALARYLFGLVGPLLCVSAAIFLYQLAENFNVKRQMI